VKNLDSVDGDFSERHSANQGSLLASVNGRHPWKLMIDASIFASIRVDAPGVIMPGKGAHHAKRRGHSATVDHCQKRTLVSE
jgi:hypothetical protein